MLASEGCCRTGSETRRTDISLETGASRRQSPKSKSTINKIRDHNSYVAKQRNKFADSFFEKYPEKKNETNEDKFSEIPEDCKEHLEELETNDSNAKRSMSLGIRNKTFKTCNLSFNKEKQLNSRKADYSERADEQKENRCNSLNFASNSTKNINGSYSTPQQNSSGISNKENLNRLVRKTKNARIP